MDKMTAPQKTTAKTADESEKTGNKILAFFKNDGGRYALSAILLFCSAFYCIFAISYTKANVETMDQYSSTLWGNDASFNALI
ncbi:MAG: hypothetical protein IJ373_03265, partial [Clostridia bacterium]|nr:hypothetical protein [Clostridia bacterium]